MRGIISEKLKDFIDQVNVTAKETKKNGVKLTPELVRENLNKLAVFIGQGPEIKHVQDAMFIVEGANSHNIAVRIYSPAPEQSLPVVLHYHGGGHMCGSIDLYDAVSRKIAKAGNCIVIAVEYRLAPEFPYPKGVHDCQYALEHFKDLLTEVQYNEQLIIAGDSAGGAICTTLSSNNLTNQMVKIDKQILIYPSVDYSLNHKSIDENGTGFLLEKDKISWYFERYFQTKKAREELSPLYMPMNQKLPKTLIFIAGCDPLRDEGIAYKDALINNDVNVEYHMFDDLIHAYMLLDSLVESECRQTYQLIGEFIKA